MLRNTASRGVRWGSTSVNSVGARPPFKFMFQKEAKPSTGNSLRATNGKWSSYKLPTPSATTSIPDIRNDTVKSVTLGIHNKESPAAKTMAVPVKERAHEGLKTSNKGKKRRLVPHKQLISLTPAAVAHLRSLCQQPEPKLIRISAKHRGCAGLSYDLSYIDAPGKFDEVVEQDGVRVVIDSKALFSVVGSEMDWVENRLFSKFVFKNPNSKGTCGCGESFMI
ncbi:Iron-sulfur cluster biosynthesis [Nakaseomyces glabratus]|nr:Iron-sulfur cluster biosynthesis [Nakaseomyces glabratus]KAH7605476.1 Iron-sulfur cluster biosynthesis [Nakaseomyces glabratus]KAH7614481.1 Iron-sulfur cluster biosynthesis [Nakaseomyces glabratus]